MIRIAQFGILLAALGFIISLMGLFPGIILLNATPGFGAVQILILLVGLTVVILGVLIFVRFMFYANQPLTLVQQIGVRIIFTGLTFTALTALADYLGFGSNVTAQGEDVLIGPLQLAGMLLSFGIASLGVVVFALAGNPEVSED